jgi:hypothetical protein
MMGNFSKPSTSRHIVGTRIEVTSDTLGGDFNSYLAAPTDRRLESQLVAADAALT